VVTPQFLWRNARYAILVITVLAAVFTPSPDATTMLLFMAPMIGLYFVGVGIAFVVFRRRQRAAVVRAGVR
jgi:sec-independent protein translocase protein TatC